MALCVSSILLIACDSNDAHEADETLAALDALRQEVASLQDTLENQETSEGEIGDPTPSPQVAFTLQLLHASDMDGAAGALGNVENFSAILDGFRKQMPDNTIVLSSGDNYIPGPRYFAAGDEANEAVLGIAGDGRGDIAFLNAMGFQASALGNHELDLGTGAFASAIAAEVEDDAIYLGAAFPYLSSNLEFAGDENLSPLVVPDAQEAMLVGGGLAKSAVITVGGERIGVVGATTPYLRTITGVGGIGVEPEDGSDMDELASIIQRAVDQLVGQGIDKIILLAHMQRIDIEEALASRLSHIDIIVAGGSNTILADENDRLRPGDQAAGAYPLRLVSATGEPVLLVNTDADYRYLGRLVAGFDQNGVVAPESVDPFVSGVYATDRQGGQRFSGRPIPEVSRIARALNRTLKRRDSNILGSTSVYLAGGRQAVRTQETNLGNLTADANLWMARQLDPDVAVSLKNAGGIRDDIGIVVQPPGTIDPSDVMPLPPPANPDAGKREGDISQFDVESVLRFNNKLVIIPITARQLVEIMEHAVGFDGVGEATVGRFPQIAGMRFSFDPTKPEGQRVRSLAIVDDRGNITDRVVELGSITGDPGRVIEMATVNFVANGGDGYPFPTPAPGRIDFAGEADQPNAPNPDFPDTNGNGVIDGPAYTDPGLADFVEPGGEQDALAEYLASFFADTPFDLAETPPLEDRRIQNLGIPGSRDTVLESPAGQ